MCVNRQFPVSVTSGKVKTSLNEVSEHVETKQDEKQRVERTWLVDRHEMDLGRRKGKREKNGRFKRAKVC
jgi:hypothetical protein